MYLSELNIGEKKNFLELAFYAMGLNGEHKQEEQQIFNSFINECELSSYEPKKQQNIESVIKVIAKSANKNKRIVLIELFGIILADNEFCDAEEAFIEKLSLSLKFDDYQVKKIKRWVEAMNDIVQEGFQLINKD